MNCKREKIKVTHVFVLSHNRHVLPYINFIRTLLSHPQLEHRIVIYTNEDKQIYQPAFGDDLSLTNQRDKVVTIVRSAGSKHKVILHGLYDNVLLLKLITNHRALRHVIWSMWGADLYYEVPKGIKGKIIDFARRQVLPIIGCKIGLQGDFDYLEKQCKKNCGNFTEIGFPAWLYNQRSLPQSDIKPLRTNRLNALVGNSGDRTNNYFEVISLLANSTLFHSLTFVLNYGASLDEVEAIKNAAKEKLNHLSLTFLTEKCDYLDFVQLVSQHDAVIYNHDRQQGVGTLNIACEFGLYLFIPNKNPLTQTYRNWQIETVDTHSIDTLSTIDLPSIDARKRSQKNIRAIYQPQICADKLITEILRDQ